MTDIRQFTKEEALAIAKGGEWKDWTDEEVVKFQLFQDLICMDWGRFHEAVENVLGRGVFTHEFAGDKGQQRLIEEYLGKRPKPTMEEIIALISKDKLIFIL